MRCPILAELPTPPSGKAGWPWTIESPQTCEFTPNGQPWPRISIVTPSYNQGQFIEECIRSVLLNGYRNIELIIIDGGSVDNTVEILERYDAQTFFWVSEPDQGQSHALNKGFAKASGSIMAWICADDIYLPGAFLRAAEFFHNNPDAEFLYGDGQLINEHSELIRNVNSGPVLDRNNFHNYNYVFSTTSFWKDSLWKRSGGYIDESNNWTMDWELFIRMNQKAELHYRPGRVSCLRHHSDTKTFIGINRVTTERNREIAMVSRKYGGWFCYNSLIYTLLRIANLSRFFIVAPKPIYSLFFWLLHLPIRMTGKGKLSIFFNGHRIP
jgi:glycosyltransferase involved in cell wall biosynthesis